MQWTYRSPFVLLRSLERQLLDSCDLGQAVALQSAVARLSHVRAARVAVRVAAVAAAGQADDRRRGRQIAAVRAAGRGGRAHGPSSAARRFRIGALRIRRAAALDRRLDAAGDRVKAARLDHGAESPVLAVDGELGAAVEARTGHAEGIALVGPP